MSTSIGVWVAAVWAWVVAWINTGIGVWVAALLTLGILSFLYKDNPFYKVAESIFIGVSAAYWFVYMIYNVLKPNLIGNLQKGHWEYFIAAILGVMMLLRLVPKIGWLSRWAIAFMIGTGAGLNFIVYLQSNVMKQIKGTLVPLNSIGNIIMIVGVVTGLIYFFFSAEHKGVLGGAAKVGIWFIMVSFGASFGYTVMARISLLIGRMHFLFSDWLRLLH